METTVNEKKNHFAFSLIETVLYGYYILPALNRTVNYKTITIQRS